MDIDLLKEDLIRIGRRIYERGYSQGTGGNISCRIPDTDLFLIKKSGVNLVDLEKKDILVVNDKGIVVEGDGIPSKEVHFHIGIMKTRSDVNAVVHCHPDYSIAFANAGVSVPLVTVTAKKLVGNFPIVESAPSGTIELTNNVVRAFENEPGIWGVLMEEHGICTVGKDIEEAYNKADIIEATAKQAYLQANLIKNKEYLKSYVNNA